MTTVAGSGEAIFANGQGPAASFAGPRGLAVDARGDLIVADTSNHRIRKILRDGTVTTLAGSGFRGCADGPGAAATFHFPRDVAIDTRGNVVVADYRNHRIRRIAPDGRVTTVAGSGAAAFLDGPAVHACFNYPSGVAVNSSGDIFVCDQANRRVRRVTPDRKVSTFAGSGAESYSEGVGTAASFNCPMGIAVDKDDNLYVTDQGNHCVCKITIDGTVSTLAGSGNAVFSDGIGEAASFRSPFYLAVDADSNVVVGDYGNNRIRVITKSGEVTTIAGSGNPSSVDGQGTKASLSYPTGVAVTSDGSIITAESGANKIRRVEASLLAMSVSGAGELSLCSITDEVSAAESSQVSTAESPLAPGSDSSSLALARQDESLEAPCCDSASPASGRQEESLEVCLQQSRAENDALRQEKADVQAEMKNMRAQMDRMRAKVKMVEEAAAAVRLCPRPRVKDEA